MSAAAIGGGLRLLAAVALLATAPVAASAQTAEVVTFPNGALELGGFLWRPASAAPAPALLWNHGSERLPGDLAPLGRRFTAEGFVFFVPHRRGQGRSAAAGPYIMDQLAQARGPARGSTVVRLFEEQFTDQIAALEFLRRRPEVDAARLFVAGCSFGGTQTLLAAERNLGYRAGIAFATAAQTWASTPELQQRLRSAARGATIPLWLVYAANDFDTAPGTALAAALRDAGKPHALTVYPAFGASARDGHAFCHAGGEIWIPDAIAFFRREGG